MSKKTNPSKRPATQADVNKAKREATDIAIKRTVKMVLYILLDKHDAPAEEVQQLSNEIGWLANGIVNGIMSWNDVDRVLKEYDVKINWL